MFHPAWSNQCLPSDEDHRRWWIEDSLQTYYGYFKYQVMPFGLTNVPTTFQSYINKVWAKKLDVFMIVYLDDIFIYTKSKGKEYVEAVW